MNDLGRGFIAVDDYLDQWVPRRRIRLIDESAGRNRRPAASTPPFLSSLFRFERAKQAVGRVPVEAVAVPVVAACRTWVGVSRSILDVAE